MAQGARAFFSYSRDDSDFALKLAGDLKAGGASVWLDQVDITPGDQWDRAVEDALTNCPRLLVILSPASVSSRNVMDEVSFALEKGKTVIPVLYRDCAVPFRLRRVQHVDFRQDYGRGLQDLLKTLAPEQGAGQSRPAISEKAEQERLTREKAGAEVPPGKPPAPPKSPSKMKYVVIAVIALILIVAGVLYFSQRGRKRGSISLPAKPVPSQGEVRVNPEDGLKYVWIQPGRFMMGCSPGDSGCDGDEKPAHQVTITKGFWMGHPSNHGTHLTPPPLTVFLEPVGCHVGKAVFPEVSPVNDAKSSIVQCLA